MTVTEVDLAPAAINTTTLVVVLEGSTKPDIPKACYTYLSTVNSGVVTFPTFSPTTVFDI